MTSELIAVSSTDELTVGGRKADRVRELGEFKPTNAPLSAWEIEHRQRDQWPPHTIDNIGELAPVADQAPVTDLEPAPQGTRLLQQHK